MKKKKPNQTQSCPTPARVPTQSRIRAKLATTPTGLAAETSESFRAPRVKLDVTSNRPCAATLLHVSCAIFQICCLHTHTLAVADASSLCAHASKIFADVSFVGCKHFNLCLQMLFLQVNRLFLLFLLHLKVIN